LENARSNEASTESFRIQEAESDKKRAGSKSCPSQLRRTLSYIKLVAIVVMMMAVVAVNSRPIVVPGTGVVSRVPIRSVVTVRVIAVSIRIVVVAVLVSWIPNSNSYAPDSD
jgi:hypothetical protein